MTEHDLLVNNQIYAFGMIVNTLVTAMGMCAENEQRRASLQQPAYLEDAFQKVINDNRCHHNGIITMLQS